MLTKNRPKDQQVHQDDRDVTVADEVTEEEVAIDEAGETDELTQAQTERDAYFDQLQRSVAEFTNYRRRTEQERNNLVALVRRDVLSQFLPVIDDFERALGQLPEDERENGWITGFTMINTKLQGILERSGVAEVNPVNEAFDPSEHEAVATEPGTSGACVAEVYQKGYRIGDVLIRPAMVKTGDPVEPSNDGQAESESAPPFDA